MNSRNYVIGVDFGTDSVRSVIIDAADGFELAASIFSYPRWCKGMYSDASAHRFRQHPLDYLEGLETSIRDCLALAGPEAASQIRSISVDTTGSTPIAVNRDGTPLSLLPEFAHNPNAMFVLWKDHTAVGEAAELNAHARKFDTDYLQFVGGVYSSEWYWAKALHILRADEAVRNACYTWVEHCDWIPFVLTGGSSADSAFRGVCSAGHKSLWSPAFGGLPPDDFFTSLDPLLSGYAERFGRRVFDSSVKAGTLSPEWARRLGLSEAVIVGVGAFDCHMGAVGGQIEPYHLSKVMGTSTCDMMVAPLDAMKGKLVRGICGQVEGSIIPGMLGMEAGQSAFGDLYAWFADLLLWAVPENEKRKTRSEVLSRLSEAASRLSPLDSMELSLDWINGRRTPDANQALTAVIAGLSLASDAPSVFRSIVEASCFGARAIIERFRDQGVPVKGLIGLGGVARKSPFAMQMMADVTGMPIRIHRSEQTCAAGAAMFAATAAGLYDRVEDAMEAMGQGFDLEYRPASETKEIYERRYRRYRELGAFVEKNTMPNG